RAWPSWIVVGEADIVAILRSRCLPASPLAAPAASSPGQPPVVAVAPPRAAMGARRTAAAGPALAREAPVRTPRCQEPRATRPVVLPPVVAVGAAVAIARRSPSSAIPRPLPARLL